jgi:hypothetical protein
LKGRGSQMKRHSCLFQRQVLAQREPKFGYFEELADGCRLL